MLLRSVDSKHTNQVHHRAAAPALSRRLKHTHTRQRSSSWDATTTFYSDVVAPAPEDFHSEALSSLIHSLKSVSDAEDADEDRRVETSSRKEEDTGNTFDYPVLDPGLYHTSHHRSTLPASDDEHDFCPPPVAGYNTINAAQLPARPKTAGADKPSRRFKDKQFQRPLQYPKSQANIKTVRHSRDLQSPESLQPVPYSRSLYGNDSVTSLALSQNSKLSRTKSPFKMFFSSRLANEHPYVESRPATTKNDSLELAYPLSDKERDPHRFSAFVTVGKLSTDTERKESDTKTLSSISPTIRNDLNENFIPSRRSSLRSGPRRSSHSSRDLKSLNIDQDLIEENHETVQRIRELQQAREKRHNEWRKEAKRSEKAAKRLSMPNSNPNSSPAKHTASIRSSWHSKVVETPESDDSPHLSARVNGDDLAAMPAFTEAMDSLPLTPVEQIRPLNDDLLGLSRNLSVTASTTQSVSSVRRHRKRLSDSIKRVSSIRQSVPDDAKAISDEVEAFLGSPRLTNKIRHPRTGRTIAFSEVGDPNGFVVFCCVGMGLTRFVTSFYDEVAKAQKLRLITPDRSGVGETDPMPAERSTPLAWVDDVAVICTNLGIEKFSLLAHSAGAIYALATALKMPQYIRGRIHLLAPWIPPSQLATSIHGSVRAANLPTSHKILSFLPASFMKAANSRFLSATSASIEPRPRRRERLAAEELALDPTLFKEGASLSTADFNKSHGSMLPTPETTPTRTTTQRASAHHSQQLRSPPQSPTPGSTPAHLSRLSPLHRSDSSSRTPTHQQIHQVLTPQARQKMYNTTLTHRTWSLATLNANPAIDLVICLERRRPIGFRYTDITRSVVIHHGANDTRVPLDNVRWLSTAMKRAELRVLENEGHGLMASATVMANVLGEIAKEWEEWNEVAKVREKKRKAELAREEQEAREAERNGRKGYPKW